MDETIKADLLGRFAAYLDTEEPFEAPAAGGEAADLYSVYVELAGLRNEVRTESRLVKDALDQFRAVFDLLQANQATMQTDLDRARAEARSQPALRPLLLDMIDLRDRLLAALSLASPRRRGWRPWRRREQAATSPWQEGLRMTLRRLDQALADRQVVSIPCLGQPFDPVHARAVGVAPATDLPDGVVVEEVRAGFMWEDRILRVADVIVAKRPDAAS